MILKNILFQTAFRDHFGKIFCSNPHFVMILGNVLFQTAFRDHVGNIVGPFYNICLENSGIMFGSFLGSCLDYIGITV